MHELNISLVELARPPRQHVDVYIGEKSYVSGVLDYLRTRYQLQVSTYGHSHASILFEETPDTKITFENGRFAIRGVSIQ